MEKHLKEIVAIQLGHLRARLKDQSIVMEITEEASEFLVKVNHDPHYGARPLKRSIQKQLENSLGRLILEGKVSDGDLVMVEYDAKKDALTFTSQKAELETELVEG